MKNILITGKNSYIGTSLEKWLLRNPDEYKIDTIDLREKSWKEKDFSIYDVVVHVAGIAHIKETSKNHQLYFSINRDLAMEVARKSKDAKVNQFIFLSSMSVYGLETGIIDKNTLVNPNTAYGRSKYEAEVLINRLNDIDFRVAIVRPPMVYGKGCRGNYQKLSRLAKITPIFPKIDSQRSMIYIDNLSEFFKQIIDIEKVGVFYPQNSEYVNTGELVLLISYVHKRTILLTKLFNPILRAILLGKIGKLFGNLTYDKKISEYSFDYNVVKFAESVSETEKKTNE